MTSRVWLKGAVVAVAAAVAGGVGFGLGTVSGPAPERVVFSEQTPVALRVAAESGKPVVWRSPGEEVADPICHAWIGLPDGTAWKVPEIVVGLAQSPVILEQDNDIIEGSGMGWGCKRLPSRDSGSRSNEVLPRSESGDSNMRLPDSGGNGGGK
ncbi:hypothetical protein [Mycolicibacter virginiensis]|uniref:hypothetical protein n=1 Tax=Mycolicibacter virginiensis TaxID=1795032 RepID=UPI001F03C3B4|nr:hypothetical protein [Mycolicibacter virginiensis]ULP48063.1 hypothetical protein MJO54_02505 [Mycolicibacter virginiensis]